MCYRITSSHLLKFQPEQVPVVAWIGVDFRGTHVVTQGIEVDVIVRINDSASKLDRRYVAFTGGSETHNEPTGPFWISLMIWHLNHRGIK